MKKEWSLLSVRGRGDFLFYEKLKKLKLKIKDWNKKVYGWIDLSIKEKIKKQYYLDQYLVANARGNIAEAIESRRVISDEI